MRWLGHASFLVELPGGPVWVTDPPDPAVGYPEPEVRADVVTVSHEHYDHNHVASIRGRPLVLRGLAPGGGWAQVDEAVGNARFRSVGVYHDARQGAERGRNAFFVVEADDGQGGRRRYAHAGDLGHVPGPEQVAAIGPVDLLMIPVGGFFTLEPEEVLRAVERLRPRVVVPMHYATSRTQGGPGRRGLPIQPLERFLALWKGPVRSLPDDAPLESSPLPAETEVWAFETFR
ncbi:MAG: MBL fold metallo-hydrolase [Clostridia bacterium]|nr:MBL fold metallo-hydrolase [Clostridia bacterium]MCL6521831.1 MBL fold metallo-hydrolase [Bacillota bacterium]